LFGYYWHSKRHACKITISLYKVHELKIYFLFIFLVNVELSSSPVSSLGVISGKMFKHGNSRNQLPDFVVSLVSDPVRKGTILLVGFSKLSFDSQSLERTLF